MGTDHPIDYSANPGGIWGLFYRAVNALLAPAAHEPLLFPDGKKFAFTIIDDTDEATVENVRPVYDYLHKLGLLTTKTVWVLRGNDTDGTPNYGETLRDHEYLQFIRKLNEEGFEIAFHGARGGDSKREEIIDALETFRDLIGYYPAIHINHFVNKDNLYWGAAKLNNFLLRLLYKVLYESKKYYGEKIGSEYFWGDIAGKHINYSANFSFHAIDMLEVNPGIPYHDPRRPYIKSWFHTADGGNLKTFNNLLNENNIDRLERQGGVCIVYTHFGKGFCSNGGFNEVTEERLKSLASRDGWFVPAGTILDYLSHENAASSALSYRQKLYIELRWVLEKLIYGAS